MQPEARDVEERLVNAQRLNERGEFLEDREDPLRHRSVFRHVGRHVPGPWQTSPGLDDRHRRADAMLACLVGRRSYNAARPEPTNHHRNPDQGRIIQALNFDIERVHVNVHEARGECVHASTVPPSTLQPVSASLVHLIRHGEVENPHHIVYADLPGYGLSQRGVAQAEAAGIHLADREVEVVLTSPLLRAKQTATAIAAMHNLEVTFDNRLLEWGGGTRWAGVRWEQLDDVFPGELAAYLETPFDLPETMEPILDCGARVAAAVRDAAASLNGGEIAVVSHQDPIHAGYLDLAALRPDRYHADKPNHAGIVTLRPVEGPWRRVGYWEPDQGPRFPPIE